MGRKEESRGGRAKIGGAEERRQDWARMENTKDGGITDQVKENRTGRRVRTKTGGEQERSETLTATEERERGRESNNKREREKMKSEK